MKRVLMLASCWNSSRTFSTPSSTKETAPTWMPIIFEGGAASAANALNAAVWRKERRFIGGCLLVNGVAGQEAGGMPAAARIGCPTKMAGLQNEILTRDLWPKPNASR